MARFILGFFALSLFCIYANAQKNQNCGLNEELKPCGRILEAKCPHLRKIPLNNHRNVKPADCVLECGCKKGFLRTNLGDCDIICDAQSCE